MQGGLCTTLWIIAGGQAVSVVGGIYALEKYHSTRTDADQNAHRPRRIGGVGWSGMPPPSPLANQKFGGEKKQQHSKIMEQLLQQERRDAERRREEEDAEKRRTGEVAPEERRTEEGDPKSWDGFTEHFIAFRP